MKFTNNFRLYIITNNLMVLIIGLGKICRHTTDIVWILTIKMTLNQDFLGTLFDTNNLAAVSFRSGVMIIEYYEILLYLSFMELKWVKTNLRWHGNVILFRSVLLMRLWCWYILCAQFDLLSKLKNLFDLLSIHHMLSECNISSKASLFSIIFNVNSPAAWRPEVKRYTDNLPLFEWLFCHSLSNRFEDL